MYHDQFEGLIKYLDAIRRELQQINVKLDVLVKTESIDASKKPPGGTSPKSKQKSKNQKK